MSISEILDSIIMYALVFAVVCLIRAVADLRYWLARLEHKVEVLERKERF